MQSVLLKPVDTRVLKGIAIPLMLTHHLFYNDSMNGMFGEVSLFGVRVVHEIGLWSKVCVTIFVLLSGYGLEVTSKGKVIHLLDFYKHRFKKLMINYWFVWILTVPIGIFVFGHSLNGVYGNHIVIKCILDFFGLINFTGSYGYNPTWWFYSCIIAMYLLFPLFHVMSDGLGGRMPLLTWVGALLISLRSSTFFLAPVANYILLFLAGIWLAKLPVNSFKKISKTELVLTFLLLTIFRNRSGQLTFIVDSLLAVILVLIVWRMPLKGFLGRTFEKLGKHSMNMFLVHSFFISQWFTKETYILYNPILILLQLMTISYFVSVVIEYIKQKIHFYDI